MVSTQTPPRKPHRHANLPPYIRRIRNGRYQARPYCDVERKRYNLGTFASVWEAQKALAEFWAGKRRERSKYVRQMDGAHGPEYLVTVPVQLGRYSTPDAADAAVKRLLKHLGGPLFWATDLHERGKHDAGRPVD